MREFSVDRETTLVVSGISLKEPDADPDEQRGLAHRTIFAAIGHDE